MEKTMSKAPKNKPMDQTQADELFIDTPAYFRAQEDFMESKGYKWNRSEGKWVDDGSLALEWADRMNDEKRDRELEVKENYE
jgi:hypothetical protein